MDDGQVKELVELAHRVAEVGKDPAHKVKAIGRGCRNVCEGPARHVFHDHDELLVLTVALNDTGQVRKTHAVALGSIDALVRTAEPWG